MRQDELEVVAAEIAGALVAELTRAVGVRVPPEVTARLAAVARKGVVRGLSRLSAVRIEADTAKVADLRTR